MASIVQNLPSAPAKSARMGGRNKPAERSEATSFDQLLKQSAERKPTERPAERAQSAEKPAKPRSAKAEPGSPTPDRPPADVAAVEKVQPQPPAAEQPLEQPLEQPDEATAGASHQRSIEAPTAVAPTVSQAFEAVIPTRPIEEANPEASLHTVVPTSGEDPHPLTLPRPLVESAPKAVPQSQVAATAGVSTDDGGEETGVHANIALPEKEGFIAAETLENEPVAPLPANHPAQPASKRDLGKDGERTNTNSSLSAEAPTSDVPIAQAQPQATAITSEPTTSAQVAAAAPVAAPAAEVQQVRGPLQQTSTTSARFAEVNHPQIVSTVRGQLLPDGGMMQIRLDPPELGVLLVQVTVRGGLIDASFQTDNAQATQMLSNSLTQLKHSLEGQGVSVDKLSVAQTPRGERTDQQNDRNGSQQNQQNEAQFDWERHSNQQRKEMLRRMWAKLGVGDPLDLVA